MPVRYHMIIDLSHLLDQVRIETTFDDFGAAITARDEILRSMRISPVMSDPADKTETQGNGEGHEANHG